MPNPWTLGNSPGLLLPIHSVALNPTIFLCRTASFPLLLHLISCRPNMTFFCCSYYFHKINLFFSAVSWLPILLHPFLDAKLILKLFSKKKKKVILNNPPCIITKYVFMRGYLLYWFKIPIPGLPWRSSGWLCFHCRGTGSIPGQGTKIPHARRSGQKNPPKNKTKKPHRIPIPSPRTTLAQRTLFPDTNFP